MCGIFARDFPLVIGVNLNADLGALVKFVTLIYLTALNTILCAMPVTARSWMMILADVFVALISLINPKITCGANVVGEKISEPFAPKSKTQWHKV